MFVDVISHRVQVAKFVVARTLVDFLASVDVNETERKDYYNLIMNRLASVSDIHVNSSMYSIPKIQDVHCGKISKERQKSWTSTVGSIFYLRVLSWVKISSRPGR
jgi:hypothetical protein